RRMALHPAASLRRTADMIEWRNAAIATKRTSTVNRSMSAFGGEADLPARCSMSAYASKRLTSPAEMTGDQATASLAALTGRARTIFRAGLALKIVGSFVNGLMPGRALVAGFLITTNLANPGTRN